MRTLSGVGKTVRRLTIPSAEEAADGAPLLTVSDRCVQRLRDVAKDGSFLRVSVDGGGCSGFSYAFKLDKETTDDDCIIEKNGTKVVIDRESLVFLKGSTIDYSEELIRSAFQVVNNPKAGGGCSCGSSFTVKL